MDNASHIVTSLPFTTLQLGMRNQLLSQCLARRKESSSEHLSKLKVQAVAMQLVAISKRNILYAYFLEILEYALL